MSGCRSLGPVKADALPLASPAHASSSVGHRPCNLDHRESSDRYRGEIWRNGKHRVAVCRDGIQWLLQRQRPGKAGVGGAWDTIGFCTTRKALIRLHRQHIGSEAMELHGLPNSIERALFLLRARFESS